MAKTIISEGKTTNEAIEKGLKELGVSKDRVEIKVLEDEKRSFFSILTPRVVKIEMTLTAPNCPAADFIIEDVRMKVESIENVKNVDIQLVFEPEWDKDMMSEEAKLELGLL